MPKKIIYFMDHYSDFGGAANTLLRQAILVKRAKNEVIVVVSTWGTICEDYLRICKKDKIPVYEICYSVTSQPEGVDLLSVFENYEDVKIFLKEQVPDIVHSVQLNPTVELACRELNIPHIMNIYQAIPEFFRLHYADIFPRYHICDSVCYAEFWKQQLGTISYCIRTVVEDKEPNGFLIDPDMLRFVCIGLLCERKNQLEVIKAFEIAVKCHGVCGTLQLFGRVGSEYAELCQQRIAEGGLEDHIMIRGFSRNMEAVYRNSDVLICGSTVESYPNVISEALSHGLIVISTPVAGVPEVVRDGDNGYLCKGYTAESIADSIKKVICDAKAGKSQKIMENARATYEKIHSPNAVTFNLLKCYEDVMAGYKVENLYGMNELKEEFSGFIDTFYRYENYFACSDYVKMNLWKIYYVIQFLNKVKTKYNYYIWGTGKYGRIYKEILDVFAPNVTLAGYIDSYGKGEYMGHEIVEPDKALHRGKNIILVGIIAKRNEVFDILNNNKFHYNDDYFIFDSMNW